MNLSDTATRAARWTMVAALAFIITTALVTRVWERAYVPPAANIDSAPPSQPITVAKPIIVSSSSAREESPAPFSADRVSPASLQRENGESPADYHR
jgi:hypothetical protein